MIELPVSVVVGARTATIAQVREQLGDHFIFDLLDAQGMVAQSRYAVAADCPFTLTQAEIDAAVLAETFIVNVEVLPPLADEIAAAVAKTYADVDAVYALAVGNREPEYREAEADARAYKAAGYTGTASQYISGWASVQTPVLTNTQAADAIIAKADALTAAKLALRNTRFTTQAAMRAATTHAELLTAIATWDAFIASVKASV